MLAQLAGLYKNGGSPERRERDDPVQQQLPCTLSEDVWLHLPSIGVIRIRPIEDAADQTDREKHEIGVHSIPTELGSCVSDPHQMPKHLLTFIRSETSV